MRVVSTNPAQVDERPWSRLRLRVPRADESLYAVPPLAEGLSIAARNRELLGAARIDLQGRSLQRLRAWSRESIVAAASAYTSTWLGREPVAGLNPLEQPLFLAGHQPALFHPGVWAKNFALGALGARASAITLNLVVDNDTLGSTAIRVPAGTCAEPTLMSVPFDAARPVQPWEDARILDPGVFENFPREVVSGMAPWGVRPMVDEFWPAAVKHREQSERLADCLTAARNQFERRWGVSNLELPISHLCRLDPFLWFASHLLAHLPRFREVHNQALAEYRHVNRVRSHSHPVPDLVERDGWHEAPFWIWRQGDLHRSRVYARQEAHEMLLSDGREVCARLPLTPDKEACCAVEALRELEARGIRLRTRALTTTLYSRLCVSDLFLHGIGGAKYDEMTDRILSRFYGVPAPGFLTVSATLWLLDPYPVSNQDERTLRRELRDLEWNPERALRTVNDPAAESRLREWDVLLQNHPPALERGSSAPLDLQRQSRIARHAHHVRLQELKRRMAELTVARPLAEQLQATRSQLQANQVLQSREFAFCLYPLEKLQTFFSRGILEYDGRSR